MIDRTVRDLLSRRTLTGLAAAGVSAPLLAACGDDSSDAADPGTGSSSSAPGSTGSTPSEGASSSGDPGLTSTSDIEVGGGAIFADEKVVITQPSEGEFRGFSAVCTHQGCLVAEISDGTINCGCHGSRFSIETGEPEAGPANAPLGEVELTVSGDQISLA